MSEKILITGGLGYLGGRVVKHFLDNTDLAIRVGSRRINNEVLPDWLRRLEIVPLDLLSEEQILQACQGVKYIIHLAALNEVNCAKWPDQALLINAYGTMKLAQVAEKNGVRRIIYLSTAHIYSPFLTGTFTESTIPQPGHPYSISKLAGEYFILANKKIKAVVLRLSNGFGYPIHVDINRWRLVANDFCRQAILQRKIVLKSNGEQYRDFVTFTDVTNAILHCLFLPDEKLDNGLFNLGSGNAIRIIDLAEFVAQRCLLVFGFRPQIVKGQTEGQTSMGPIDYHIDKLQKTGFKLIGSMEDEIDKTLRFCVSNQNYLS